jgi:tRNA dimethylallyltransferase
LAAELSLPEAVRAIELSARRYAKRQITWFRKEPGVQWFSGFGDDSGIAGAVLAYLEEHLGAWPPTRAHTLGGV